MEETKKTLLVTGARGAVGDEVVEYFLGCGYRVVGWDLSSPGEGALVSGEEEGMYWQCVDVTNPEAIETALERIEAEVGEVFGVIHLAGGFRWSKIDEIGVEDIHFLVDVNLKSSLFLARSVMKRFKAWGRGRLIFMSSRSTNGPGAGEGAYAATKAGLNALTTSLAAEVKEMNVTVNALQPSVIDTAVNREAMPEADFSEWVPRSHLAKTMEFLLSEEGVSINGSKIILAGRT